MEHYLATYIYWYLSVGLTVGLVFFLIFGKHGTSLVKSLILGGAGALALGFVPQIFSLGDNLIFAMVGAIGTLFIVNAFRSHSKLLHINLKSE